MAYSTDIDLENRRSGILQLLPNGARQQRTLAEEELLADLERIWYRPAATARYLDWMQQRFDPTRVDPAELKRLSVLKTLVYAHEFLMKYGGAEADGFERHRDFYEREYQAELRKALDAGLAYDWPNAGGAAGSADDRPAPAPRLLERA